MAPKKVQKVDKAPEAPGGVKAEQEQEPASKRAKAADGRALPAGKVSQMLGHLKYHAQHKGNELAQAGLATWGRLDLAGREKFLKAFLECDTREKKNGFKWTCVVERKVEKTDVVSAGVNKGYRYGGEVLKLCGMTWDIFKGDLVAAQKAIEELVEQNKLDWPQEPWQDPLLVSGNPAMSRWWFLKGSGEDQTTSVAARVSASSSSQVGADQAVSVAASFLGGGDPGGEASAAKDQPPEAVRFASGVKHFGCLIESLRKELVKAETIACKLAVRARQDEALGKKSSTFEVALAGERSWVQAAGMQCEEWATHAAPVDPKLQTSLEEMQETASAKLDALRLAMRNAAKFI